MLCQSTALGGGTGGTRTSCAPLTGACLPAQTPGGEGEVTSQKRVAAPDSQGGEGTPQLVATQSRGVPRSSQGAEGRAVCVCARVCLTGCALLP